MCIHFINRPNSCYERRFLRMTRDTLIAYQILEVLQTAFRQRLTSRKTLQQNVLRFTKVERSIGVVALPQSAAVILNLSHEPFLYAD